MHRTAIRMMQAEASGNLAQRIEVLSFLRVGNASEAISRLETEADSLTNTIARNDNADKRALASMKTYLSVAPPSPSREKQLATALAGVPVLAPGQCDSGLNALLLSAKK